MERKDVNSDKVKWKELESTTLLSEVQCHNQPKNFFLGEKFWF